MTGKANLTLATLVTEKYIDSANTTTDLVYFTREAHEHLSNIFAKSGLYDDLSDDDKMATHEMVDVHLLSALQEKLK